MFGSLLTCPTYHHVGPTVPPALAHLGVCTRTDQFEAHLDHFEKAYDVVDLESLLKRPWPKRPLLLTFDDSVRSLAETVAPILQRRGLPAVAFLNPDMIETEAVQFDHVLSELAGRTSERDVLGLIGPDAVASASVQAYLNGPGKTLTLAQRADLQARLLQTAGLVEATLYQQLDHYLRPIDIPRLTSAGLEVANHTASHMRCRTLSADELHHEIGAAKARLERLSGRPVRAFSVPYGSRYDLTPAVRTAVSASGHEAVFLADGRLSALGGRGVQFWDRVPMDGTTVEQLRMALDVRPRLRGAIDMARDWSSALRPATKSTA